MYPEYIKNAYNSMTKRQSYFKMGEIWDFPGVQWLRLCAPNARGLGSIPGQGTRFHMNATTKSSHAATKEPASHN